MGLKIKMLIKKMIKWVTDKDERKAYGLYMIMVIVCLFFVLNLDSSKYENINTLEIDKSIDSTVGSVTVSDIKTVNGNINIDNK